MSSALIYINPQAIHPVVDGVWHWTRLSAIPAPGEIVTMLCGVTAEAAFVPLQDRCTRGAPTQCPYCDVAYRRSLGWHIPARHPGLRPRAT
ncbi:hypothetical protein [Amycolatopsis sp. NPDC004079]|uniref:hypothetical protein n=1 Tax=Amycolatopsis sp. NPDC004079 TaxID=3154549 RepID=UPI0033B0D2DA